MVVPLTNLTLRELSSIGGPQVKGHVDQTFKGETNSIESS